MAAEILAGRRVSIRIEDTTLRFFDPDTRELLRSRPNPLTHDQPRRRRTAHPDSGCRPLDQARHRPTKLRAGHPTSVRYDRRNVRGQRGDIGGIPARRATADIPTVLNCASPPPEGQNSAGAAEL
jgi:hypothetical protein